MATGRLAHDEQVPPAPRGRLPANAALKERIAHKLRTESGKAAYRRRKAIVEPVFGQIMTCQNGRQLLLRGEDFTCGEWRLLAACHDLRKIFDTPEPPGPPPWSADQGGPPGPVTDLSRQSPDGQEPNHRLTGAGGTSATAPIDHGQQAACPVTDPRS